MVLYSLSSLDQKTAFVTSAAVPNIAYRASWRALEPQDGVFDWSGIDAALAAAPNHIDLHVLFGDFCPPWVLQHSPTVSDGIHTVPVPWNAAYQANVEHFVTRLADRYANNPRIDHFHVEPINGQSGEFKLDVGTLPQWQHVGYTPSVFVQAFIHLMLIVKLVLSPTVVSWMPGGPTVQIDQMDSISINSQLRAWYNGLNDGGINMNSGATATWVWQLQQPFGAQAVGVLGAEVVDLIDLAQREDAEFVEVYPSDVAEVR